MKRPVGSFASYVGGMTDHPFVLNVDLSINDFPVMPESHLSIQTRFIKDRFAANEKDAQDSASETFTVGTSDPNQSAELKGEPGIIKATSAPLSASHEQIVADPKKGAPPWAGKGARD
jgi:hypothetical protein